MHKHLLYAILKWIRLYQDKAFSWKVKLSFIRSPSIPASYQFIHDIYRENHRRRRIICIACVRLWSLVLPRSLTQLRASRNMISSDPISSNNSETADCCHLETWFYQANFFRTKVFYKITLILFAVLIYIWCIDDYLRNDSADNNVNI